MICAVTRKEELSTSVWSGGKTTQLFLHPPTASYAARDFAVRLSSATVDDESSVFTALPGFKRILMPLDAPMHLNYQGHGEDSLAPFEAAVFDGGWTTTSYGKCTDIGIMLAEGWTGSLEHPTPGTRTLPPGFVGIYALESEIAITASSGGESHTETLSNGDFLLLESDAPLEIALSYAGSAGAILAHMTTA